MNRFDIDNFLALAQSNGNFREFSRYVVDNGKRKLILQFVGTYKPQDQSETHERK